MASLHVKINNIWQDLHSSEGMPALDVVRGELGLTSTKEGCREGDCGACAVLVGEQVGDMVRYRAVPSCLLALGELRGKHLVTLEGLVEGAKDGLTPVMRAFLDENASQCGFCTPGFIIALTSWLAEPQVPDLAGALRAIDGNLCRCTGYGAIRRAAARLVERFKDLPLESGARLKTLVEAQVLPPSVLEFMAESAGKPEADSVSRKISGNAPARGGNADNAVPVAVVGGGTDYYVRNPDPEEGFSPFLTRMLPEFGQIRYVSDREDRWLEVGAAVTVRDFFSSHVVRHEVPGIERFETMFASTLIRNLATVGGNIVNASPVADITSMLLALGARLVIVPEADAGNKNTPLRLCPLEQFFLGYKKLNLGPGEVLKAVWIPVLADPSSRKFSFEKASKRRNLDIAAVNMAISFRIDKGRFRDVRISLGGVAPVPLLGIGAQEVLEGAPCDVSDKKSLAGLAKNAARRAESAISPISDVRGSSDYRRRMVHQLMLAHFIRLFETSGVAEELFP
ncbi:MAG: FAD binding domain-containing protein [Rectinema sp.]